VTVVVAALGAAATSYLLTALLVRVALRFRLLDVPSPGKIHSREVPTLGGLAILAAFLTVLWAFRPIGDGDVTASHLLGLTLASVAIAALGAYDDLRGCGPWAKLLVQVGAGLLLFAHGFRIDQITNPFGDAVSLGWLAVPASVLWLVVVTNAINVIDGLDGLAAGVVAIAAFTLFLISLRFGDLVSMSPALLLAAATAGFLPFNWSPARIFLGNTGSFSLGFLIGAISLIENRKGSVALTLLLPIVLLGIPILDALIAVCRRLADRRHPFQRDTRHLHHRLLGLGLSPRAVTTLLHGACVYLAFTAYLVSILPKQHAMLLIVILAIGVVLAIKALQYAERGGSREGVSR